MNLSYKDTNMMFYNWDSDLATSTNGLTTEKKEALKGYYVLT